jgi:CheY-like chemotaxis protein/HPt (histidine-containing phosphotransfer) domain-containing protein
LPQLSLLSTMLLEQTLKNDAKPVILVADDEPVNQKIFSLILEKLGYNPVTASNGEEALEKVKTAGPILAFFDIIMPRMNGFEAARKLRSSGFGNPIIAVTATFLAEDEERRKESGINDVIIKPISLSVIQAMLEKWLSAEKKPSQELPEQSPISDFGPAAFNPKEMFDAFTNDEEIVLPLLARFIERTGGQLENFRALMTSGNWADARRDAHTIKGTASSMGGGELGKMAGILELACISASAEEADAAYPNVLKAFAKFKKEAEVFIANKKTR